MFFASFLVAAYVAADPLQCSGDGDCDGGKCRMLTIDTDIVKHQASLKVVAYRTLTGATASDKGICFADIATETNKDCSNDIKTLIKKGAAKGTGIKITGNGCDDDSYCKVTVTQTEGEDGLSDDPTFAGTCAKLDDPSESATKAKCYNPAQWTAKTGYTPPTIPGICKSGYTCDTPNPTSDDSVKERYGLCSTAICSSTKKCAFNENCRDLKVDTTNITSKSPAVKTFSYIAPTATADGVCFKSVNPNAGTGNCFATAADLANPKSQTTALGAACHDGDYCLVTIATPATGAGATGACKPLPQADAACINPVKYDTAVGPESIDGFCKSPGACSINAAAVSGQDASKSASYGKCTTTTTTKTTPNTSAAVGSLFLSGFGVVMAIFL